MAKKKRKMRHLGGGLGGPLAPYMRPRPFKPFLRLRRRSPGMFNAPIDRAAASYTGGWSSMRRPTRFGSNFGAYGSVRGSRRSLYGLGHYYTRPLGMGRPLYGMRRGLRGMGLGLPFIGFVPLTKIALVAGAAVAGYFLFKKTKKSGPTPGTDVTVSFVNPGQFSTTYKTPGQPDTSFTYNKGTTLFTGPGSYASSLLQPKNPLGRLIQY